MSEVIPKKCEPRAKMKILKHPPPAPLSRPISTIHVHDEVSRLRQSPTSRRNQRISRHRLSIGQSIDPSTFCDTALTAPNSGFSGSFSAKEPAIHLHKYIIPSSQTG
ncbi:hypothetical protein ACMFMF_002303 [Clarireedia jacksonii]